MTAQSNQSLTEKELAFVSYLAKNSSNSQRVISSSLGCSLGLTNIILKRLIKTGYIKTKQLNKKKVEYLLTPKGFLEKTRKSYQYFVRTIDSLKSIKNSIQNIVLEQYGKGEKKFVIVGDNELADITEIAIRNIEKNDIVCVRSNESNADKYKDCLILLTKDNVREINSNGNTINIFNYLSNYFT